MFYSSADDTDRPEPVRSHPISISIAPLWWSSRGEKGLINAAPYINLFPPLRLCLASTCSSSNPSPPPTYIYQSKAWKMTKRGIKSTIPHHMTCIDPGMCRCETRLRVYMCTHRFDQRHVAVRRATILSYGGGGGGCLLLQHLPPRRHKYSGEAPGASAWPVKTLKPQHCRKHCAVWSIWQAIYIARL